jgi:nifR3 family TIM-barrel protein
MRIGSISLDNEAVLAPLAGITNLPFRLLAKEAGCALVCSEMISANGLVHRSRKTLDLLDSRPEEKPLSVQIFGADPAILAEAALIVEASGADIVDINFGCSVRKVLKTGAGAALMKSPEKTEAILQTVRKSIRVPLTIKIRTGWDPSGEQARNVARIAEFCGVDAIAVHPRTATQGFGGKADWSVIAAVKRNVSIPVIGNGDVVIPEDAMVMRKTTGCDAVMIGRAAIGAPWIFSQVTALFKGLEMPHIDLAHRFNIMKRYVAASVQYLGERRASLLMRSRLGWFVKGLPHSSKFREAIKRVSSEKDALELINTYMNELTSDQNIDHEVHEGHE